MGKSFVLVLPQVLATFLVFFCTSSGFGNKTVPKTEEIQKNKTLLLKPEEIPKNTKNKDFHVSCLGGPQGPRKIFFFCTSSGFGNIFLVFFCTSSGFGNIIVPKPEDVQKKTKPFLRKPEEVPKTVININILFDTTSFQLPDSGFGFQGSA